jgi:plasmid stabilization system protein ParE
MFKVVFTQAADADIAAIADYVKADNPIAAAQLRAQLYQLPSRLAQFPRSGHQVRRKKHLFKLIHGNYLLYYRIKESERIVEIVSCIHAARAR